MLIFRIASGRLLRLDLVEPNNILMLQLRMKTLILLILFTMGTAAAGSLTEDRRISSEALGYDLQYRVYLPAGYESIEDLPVLYVTDGQSYIGQGKTPRVLDRLIESGKMRPVIAVFVDPRDPDNLESNRRNTEFFCNADYLHFFEEELIPALENEYPIASNRDHRTILGVSFGGLNAACFGLTGHRTFSGIAMHSPATHPIAGLHQMYTDTEKLPLKIFLSTGAPNDNTKSNRRFRTLLKDKGYALKYVETKEGHNWDNWRPLVDDVLLYFYANAD